MWSTTRTSERWNCGLNGREHGPPGYEPPNVPFVPTVLPRECMRVVGVDWELTLRYHDRTFVGKATVTIEGAPSSVTLNALSLEIDSVRADGAPAAHRVDAAQGTLVVSGLTDGTHRLEIDYHGAAAQDGLVGLYTAPCGPSYALTTMFFPTGSGRLLPSFEHPAVKTVYRLVLNVDAGVQAVFNTPPARERDVDGRREITFEPTPLMSAYLLYLGVAPFDSFRVPGPPWTVTVWTSPGRAQAGKYSAERAVELLEEYESYYGSKYPLAKLDLLALENFWAGAMENWGAIAFRENALLVDPSTSLSQRRAVLAVVAHELGHQWFGNLVTPRDWQDFWLNESFATFVGVRVVSRRIQPGEGESYFLGRWMGAALEQDSLKSTHPVRMPVSGPDALGEVSDEVTYGKGAAILRMFEAYLGEETFRRAVSLYLAKNQYSNARAEDLWAALDEVTGRAISPLVNAWISRPGYPVIRASWKTGQLTLRQERFLADASKADGVWPVPLLIRGDGKEEAVLLDQAERSIPLPSPHGIRIDPGRTAFARVLYDRTLFGSMVSSFASLEPVEQWGLITDTRAFVLAGLVPLEDLLLLLREGRAVAAEIPVQAMVAGIAELSRPLYDNPIFLDAAVGFLRAQIERLGVDPRPGEPEFHALLREPVAETLARLDTAFAHQLARRFDEYDGLPPELRVPVAVALGRAGGADGFQRLLGRLTAATTETERVCMEAGLAAAGEPEIRRRSLDVALSRQVTPSGAFNLLVDAALEPGGGRLLFEWFREHSSDLSKIWAGTPLLSMMLRFGMASFGVDAETEVAEYFRDHAPSEAVQGVTQGLESMHLAARLRRAARAS